jgi:hypothetical protein
MHLSLKKKYKQTVQSIKGLKVLVSSIKHRPCAMEITLYSLKLKLIGTIHGTNNQLLNLSESIQRLASPIKRKLSITLSHLYIIRSV